MTILPMRIDISINESKQEYALQVEQNQQNFSINTAESITVKTIDIPEYEGPYEVVPKVESQMLNTNEKRMTNDVLIREIPYYETSNVQNGITVFIANSLNE